MSEINDGDQSLDLTVLLPYEEAAIPTVMREALRTWPGRYEILVVDDASQDGTAALAREQGARVVERVENGGSGAARKSGLRSARGALVAMLDADGSYVAAHLPELLAYFPGYDQVNGARTSEQGTIRVLRRGAKWVIRKLAERVSGKRIADLNTGMKVFKRDVMLRYLWVIPDGFSCVTSMTLAFLCNGHPVKYMPVEYRPPRIGDSKFHVVKDTAAYLFTVFRIVMYFRPLRVFFPMSLLIGAPALVKGWYDWAWSSKHTLQESDIIMVIVMFAVLIVGLLAELIVAQRREPL